MTPKEKYIRINGTEEEILQLFGMCYAYVKSAEREKSDPGIFKQICDQLTADCQQIAQRDGANWSDYLKKLDAEIEQQIAAMSKT